MRCSVEISQKSPISSLGHENSPSVSKQGESLFNSVPSVLWSVKDRSLLKVGQVPHL